MKPKSTNSTRTDSAKIAGVASAGFSLIEINLVLLIVGIGLVALLGLFPVGLRQASLATGDTVQALFADQVLDTLQAQASTITNWTEWAAFGTSVLKDAKVGSHALKANQEVKLSDYLVDGATIRYRLVFKPVTAPLDFGGRLVRAAIQVSDRAEGDLSKATVYCTDFVFQGPPPN